MELEKNAYHFFKNIDVRYLIGKLKVNKILKSEKFSFIIGNLFNSS